MSSSMPSTWLPAPSALSIASVIWLHRNQLLKSRFAHAMRPQARQPQRNAYAVGKMLMLLSCKRTQQGMGRST